MYQNKSKKYKNKHKKLVRMVKKMKICLGILMIRKYINNNNNNRIVKEFKVRLTWNLPMWRFRRRKR